MQIILVCVSWQASLAGRMVPSWARLSRKKYSFWLRDHSNSFPTPFLVLGWSAFGKAGAKVQWCHHYGLSLTPFFLCLLAFCVPGRSSMFPWVPGVSRALLSSDTLVGTCTLCDGKCVGLWTLFPRSSARKPRGHAPFTCVFQQMLASLMYWYVD